jgi:hypothetical protein
MPRDVLINAGAGEVRVAVMEDGVLDQLWLERTIGFEELPGRKRERAMRSARRSILRGCRFISSTQPDCGIQTTTLKKLGLRALGPQSKKRVRHC